MLHDPHRDLNLLAFRDFVASKDPSERYAYSDRRTCACGQYAKHIGLFDEWMDVDLYSEIAWTSLNDLAFGTPSFTLREYGDVAPERFTFGALRERLDVALAA